MAAMQGWCNTNAQPLLAGFLESWMQMNAGALLQAQLNPFREEVLRQQGELAKAQAELAQMRDEMQKMKSQQGLQSPGSASSPAGSELFQLREEVKKLKAEQADANGKIQSLLLTNLHPPGSSAALAASGAGGFPSSLSGGGGVAPISAGSSAAVQPVSNSPIEGGQTRVLGFPTRKSSANPNARSPLLASGAVNPDLIENGVPEVLDPKNFLKIRHPASRLSGQHTIDTLLPPGSRIPLSNAPGPGEEVSSELAPYQREENKLAVANAQSRAPRVGKGTGGPIDIIVVEDVGVAQKLAHAALTRGHYKVEVAGDGMQAIELFKKHMGSLKAVLMDIQLPGMSGTEATQEIRRLERECGVAPVWIYGLTGNVSAEDLINYKAAGMNGCILKGKLLADAVRQAMEESQNGVEFVNLCDKQNSSGRTVIAPTPAPAPKVETKSDLPPGPAGVQAPLQAFKIGHIKSEANGIGTPRAPEPRSLMKTRFEGSGVRAPGIGLPHAASQVPAAAAAPAGPNLLLVEDVRVSQKIALQALQRAGYKVIAADNGESAVEKYRQHSASLRFVIMDINLPGISGIEATEQIRALEKQQAAAGDTTAPVAVFGLTGNVDPESMRNYERAGMNGCILKGKVLADALGKAIEESQQGKFVNIS